MAGDPPIPPDRSSRPPRSEPHPDPDSPAASEADRDDLLPSAFGPAHWNLGCG